MPREKFYVQGYDIGSLGRNKSRKVAGVKRKLKRVAHRRNRMRQKENLRRWEGEPVKNRPLQDKRS